jgi:hypothetical protein
MEKKMNRASSLALLLAAVTLAVAPAIAKPSLQTGKNVCTAEVKKQTPAPKSVRIDDNGTRVTTGSFIYKLKVKNPDNTNADKICTFDVNTSIATLTPVE